VVRFASSKDVPHWRNEIWETDPIFERRLLIEYFQRNHAYRTGAADIAWRPASLACGLSSGYGRMARAADDWQDEDRQQGDVKGQPTLHHVADWFAYPAVLRYVQETIDCGEEAVLHALATAGLIGDLVKRHASISGAEVGCQGEIGTACAMAAAGGVQLLGGTARQTEYAAEMALEHHMGLTCDPVGGLVQIPCIERNAFAATRALTCAQYALFSDGGHRIPFDEVVAVMRQTGHDLPSLYRETASGGLAAAYRLRGKKKATS